MTIYDEEVIRALRLIREHEPLHGPMFVPPSFDISQRVIDILISDGLIEMPSFFGVVYCRRLSEAGVAALQRHD